ncbi:MAG TPA: hypothetical protein VFS08_15025 [Gemmatimonadaceae bacterium]|nr:hypothetical protein [Gemmatimonadaceae bacterium]
MSTPPAALRGPVVVAWSSGKDSAHALHVLRTAWGAEVVGLLTTVNARAGRVAMHAVRESLLRQQAEAVGLPVHVVPIPSPCSNEAYEAAMAVAVRELCGQGVRHVAFGDLFLEDVRAYRERQLRGTGLAPLFPLWGRDTGALAGEMQAAGVRATLTCVDPRVVPAELAGRSWDAALVRALPAGVDPCGERGEFHTFVTDGPAFRTPVAVQAGEVVERDGFVFADLVPVPGQGARSGIGGTE